MGKKFLKITGIVILSVLAACIIVYLVIAFYYQDKFLCQTFINDKAVKGMRVSEANAYLLQDYEDYKLTLYEQNNQTEEITGSEIDFQADYTEQLQALKNTQNIFLWGYHWFTPQSYRMEPEYSYAEERLKDKLSELHCFQLEAANKIAKVEIKKEYLGYVLVDNTTDVIDSDLAEGRIREALLTGEKDVDLNACFIPYLPTEQTKQTYALWKKIEKVQSADISIADGELNRTINAGVIGDWILADEKGMPVCDEAGELQLNEASITEFVEGLSSTFDTYGKERLWQKHNGGSVWLKYSGNGYLIDKQAEAEEIKQAVLAGDKEKRKPIYKREGNGRGKDEIGDTYIEVDMGAQKLYYFMDGRIKLTTDIVTGNTSRNNGTPEKICAIYAKQKNRTLRGDNYASFVNYWMPVSGNIGIHDATWRDEFGGEIYKTAGSHGCINLPKDKAGQLYEMAEIGTPVIIYY